MSPTADGTAAGRKSYAPDDPMSYKTPHVSQPVRYGSKKTTHLATPGSDSLVLEGLNSAPGGGQAPIPRPDFDTKGAAGRPKKRSAPEDRSLSPARSRRRSRSPRHGSRSPEGRSHLYRRRSRSQSPDRSRIRARRRSQSESRHSQSEIRPRSSSPGRGRRSRSPATRSGRSASLDNPQHLRFEVGPSRATHNRAYDDHIDELDEKLAADEASIASIRREMSKFRAVAGEVQSLKKELSEIKGMRSELTEVRTALADIVGMLKSGTHPGPLELATDRSALKPIVSASAPTTLDLEPERPTSKKKKKKKASKDTLSIQYTKDQLKLITTHVRHTSYRMMGITSAGEIQAPVQNPDGTYQWWVKNDAGQPKLRPKFAPSLTAPNTDPKTGWTQDFVEYCQDPAHMEVGKDFLSTIPGDIFIQVLEAQLWQYLWNVWKDIQSGKRESKVAQDLARGRENTRNEFKGVSRAKAREGTAVGGDKYKFLEHRGWQSPEHSDAENPNRKCVDEPAYRSEKVNQLNDALRLRYKRIVGGKASPATRTDVVWFKTNELELPNLGEDLAHPAWTINQDWAQNNPEAYEGVRYLIDEDDAQPPDFSELLRKYPPLPRKYVDQRPIPANGARLTHSRSASLAVSGAICPEPGAPHAGPAPIPSSLPGESEARFNMDGNVGAEVPEGAGSQGWEFEDGERIGWVSGAPALLQSEPNNIYQYPAPPGSHPFAYSHSHQSHPPTAYAYPMFYPQGMQPSQWRPYPPATHTQSTFTSSQAQAPGPRSIFDLRAVNASHSESQPPHIQYYPSHAGLAVASKSQSSSREQSWQLARDQQATIGQTSSQQAPANRPALPAPEQLNMRPDAPALVPPAGPPHSIQGPSTPTPNAQTMTQNAPRASTPSAPTEPEPGVTQSTTIEPISTGPDLEVPFPKSAQTEPVCAPLRAAEPSNATCALSQVQNDIPGSETVSKSTRVRLGAKLRAAQAPTRTSSRKRGAEPEAPSTSTKNLALQGPEGGPMWSRGSSGGKRGRKKAGK